MPKYRNDSIGELDIGGTVVPPGGLTPVLTAAQEKDATIAWLKDNGFLAEAKEEGNPPVAQPQSIPSPEEASMGATAVMVEEPVADPAPATRKAKG